MNLRYGAMAVALAIGLSVAPQTMAAEVEGPVTIKFSGQANIGTVWHDKKWGEDPHSSEGFHLRRRIDRFDNAPVFRIQADVTGQVAENTEVYVRSWFNIGDRADLTGNTFHDESQFDVGWAYLQNKSAWWQGGPTITTRLGRQAVIYSPWVFDLDAYGPSDGVTFSTQSGALGIDVGYFFIRPTKKDADAGTWGDGPAPDGDGWLVSGGLGDSDPVLAARLSGKIHNLSASATLVRHHANTSDPDIDNWYSRDNDAVLDYALELSAPVTDALTLSGAYARDGEHEKNAFSVKAGLAGDHIGAAGWNFGLEYRSVDEDFAPRFDVERQGSIKRAPGDHYERFYRDVSDRKSGWTLSADGAISMLNVGLEYKSEYQGDKSDEAKNELSVGLGTNLDRWSLGLDYKNQSGKGAKEDNSLWRVKAGTSFDFAWFNGLRFGAMLEGDSIDAHKDVRYGVDLAWVAPNGIELGLHYSDNFGQVTDTDYLADDFREYTSPSGQTYRFGDGFAFTAGYRVSF